MTNRFFLSILGLLLSLPALAALPLTTGTSILSGKEEKLTLAPKGQVVVFLSAVCPCSDSHIPELISLAKDFPDFTFVAVHSNVDEAASESKAYFEKAALPFPVLQDEKTARADELKAVKTPHAYILSTDGKILYQGGVSDSSTFSKSKTKPLRAALTDLKEGRAVRVAQARVLGCAISREE